MSLGHGGQILVSGSLREVVEGTFFSSRDTYRLKGVRESAEVFQVNAERLADEFPELRPQEEEPGR